MAQPAGHVARVHAQRDGTLTGKGHTMLLALPPWQAHAQRDAGLSKLLRALYRNRRDVLAFYPRVPLADESTGGSTPVAALLLLWERWDYLRGACPACGSMALGMSFGGLLTVGAVTGCCLGCARFVTRHIGGVGPILSSVNEGLQDTPYRLTLAARPAPPGNGEITYGGWGWALPPRLAALEAVLQELGAFDAPATPTPVPSPLRNPRPRRRKRDVSPDGIRYDALARAFARAERELGTTWTLEGRGHCERVTLRAHYARRARLGAAGAVRRFRPHQAMTPVYVFPLALVCRAARLLRVNPRVLISRAW